MSAALIDLARLREFCAAGDDGTLSGAIVSRVFSPAEVLALVEAVEAAQTVFDLGETVLAEPAPEWNRLAGALSRFAAATYDGEGMSP